MLKGSFILLLIQYVLVPGAFASHTELPSLLAPQETKGVALLVHGLNTKPEKMGTLQGKEGSIASTLRAEGYDIVRVSLPGHEGPIEEMESLNASSLKQSAIESYAFASQLAKDKKVPLILVAYSLGALVYEVLLNEQKVHFNRVILFAPALYTKWYTNSVLGLAFILGEKGVVPSASPPEYRAQKGTSIAAYKALFQLEEEFQKSEKRVNIPTLVLIDKLDELINVDGLIWLSDQNSLDQWEFAFVESNSYHHLIIDDHVLGAKQWKLVNKKMREFLQGQK